MPDSTTKRAYTPREPRTFNCEWCTEPFESRATVARYCSGSCKERARYVRDREKRIALVRKYRTENAEKVRAAAAARRDQNAELIAQQRRQSYLRHRDRRIAEACAYQRDNPHIVARTRNRRRSAEQALITERDLRRLLQRHRGRCAYCDIKLLPWGREHENSLQWDHVLPLFRGGRDSIGNLAPSCRFCNHSKNRKTLMEWRLTRTDSRWRN